MQYVVGASEMKQYDENTITHFRIPGLVLMERAAMVVADEIEKELEKELTGRSSGRRTAVRVLVVAGCGNNGGDGLAAGRLLRQRGLKVTFVMPGNREKCSESAKRQMDILERYGIKVLETIPAERYDVIIDAIFGIGVARKVEGAFAEAIEIINRMDALKIAVDMPSGIHTDTGRVMGCAVKADMTVTFAFRKKGLLLYPGAAYAGRVICRDIGITESSFLGKRPEMTTFTGKASEVLPVRRPDGNKGTFGKVLLLAGSRNMCGACFLSALGAFRIGAGMVRIVTEECNRSVLQQMLPEAMLSAYDGETDREAMLLEAFAWADIIAAGPGMGTSAIAAELLHIVITGSRLPLILDADAVNLLAANDGGRDELTRLQASPQTTRELIITPHPGEFARLLGRGITETLENREVYAKETAKRLRAVIVAKDARTLVCHPDGTSYLNISGNSGMATAGSGDVLTGIIAGLLAQGMCARAAADVGVYVHGMAGDQAAARQNAYSLTAGDLADALKYLLDETNQK